MSGSPAIPNERSVTGLLLVDKPAGCTSHDVVSVVRRAARTKRVGHAGTLDPFATGLLVIAVGPCTRLLPYLASEPKVYDAVIAFGSETNTDDSTGVTTRTAPLPDLATLPGATAALTGTLAQIPPAFSAKHVDGQRAYVMARRGEAVALPPNDIVVHEWIIQSTAHIAATASTPATVTVNARITCGGGTYIRALARDLGLAMHSAAHCASLRRVSSGHAHIEQAVPYASLMPGAIADGLVSLHNPLTMLEPMAHEQLDDAGLAALSHGRSVPATHPGARAALVRGNTVVAIAERSGVDEWQPRVVLLSNPLS